VNKALIGTTRGLSFLNEPEYMIRSRESTPPYEMGHDPEKYAAEPGSDKHFKNSDFAFFISISVIYVLEHCGEEFEHPLN